MRMSGANTLTEHLQCNEKKKQNASNSFSFLRCCFLIMQGTQSTSPCAISHYSKQQRKNP